MKSCRFVLSIFVVALLVLSASAVPKAVVAETATDLRCNGCVGKKDLGKKAVRSKSIKPKAIRATHLADGTVLPQHLSSDAVLPQHLSAAAKPGGVDYLEGDLTSVLSATSASVISVEITVPAAGFVTVLANWYMLASGTDGYANCGLDPAEGVIERPKTVATIVKDAFASGATMRTFSVSGGTTRFHLNCSGSSTLLFEPVITAMFFPNRY